MRVRHWVNGHKGSTFLAILAMMALHDAWSNPTAWMYLGLHGTYGWLWVLKSRIFPDKTWEMEAGIGRGSVIVAGLSLYWLAPWIITSRGVTVPPWMYALVAALYALGVFLHFTSDMQKHTSLQLRPGQLVEGGMFRYIRNVNYLGELLIYLSFALLSLHVVPLLVLAAFVLAVWLPLMWRKDRSLARYEGFEEYSDRTSLFIPFLY